MEIQPGVDSGFSHTAEGLGRTVTQQWIAHHPAALGEQLQAQEPGSWPGDVNQHPGFRVSVLCIHICIPYLYLYHITTAVFAWLAKCLHPCSPSHASHKYVGFSFSIWKRYFSVANIPFCPSFGTSFHCLQNGLGWYIVTEGWITECLDLKLQLPIHLSDVILSSHCSFLSLSIITKGLGLRAARICPV